MNKEQEELTLNYLDSAKKLASQLSYRFRLSPSKKEDCESIAVEELCKCAVTFDSNKGESFNSYLRKTLFLKFWQYVKIDFNAGMKSPRHIGVDGLRTIEIISLEHLYEELMSKADTTDVFGEKETMIDFKSSLTSDENNVLNYLLHGYTVKEIAMKEKLPEWKVYLHKKNIKEKLHQILAD